MVNLLIFLQIILSVKRTGLRHHLFAGILVMPSHASIRPLLMVAGCIDVRASRLMKFLARFQLKGRLGLPLRAHE